MDNKIINDDTQGFSDFILKNEKTVMIDDSIISKDKKKKSTNPGTINMKKCIKKRKLKPILKKHKISLNQQSKNVRFRVDGCILKPNTPLPVSVKSSKKDRKLIIEPKKKKTKTVDAVKPKEGITLTIITNNSNNNKNDYTKYLSKVSPTYDTPKYSSNYFCNNNNKNQYKIDYGLPKPKQMSNHYSHYYCNNSPKYLNKSYSQQNALYNYSGSSLYFNNKRPQ